MTLAQVQALDAASRLQGHRLDFPFRGVRTGAKPPPAGYSPEDFRIPTLAEVFAAFPDKPINIEIKGKSDLDVGSFLNGANLLASFLNANAPGRADEVIVVSFNDAAVQTFHLLAPSFGSRPGSRAWRCSSPACPPPPGRSRSRSRPASTASRSRARR